MSDQHPGAEVHPRTQEPVIVVGAGPVGCTVALLLADVGIPVTLLERHARPHPLPRAVHLDDEVARTLYRVGVSAGFLRRSRPCSGLRLLDAELLIGALVIHRGAKDSGKEMAPALLALAITLAYLAAASIG